MAYNLQSLITILQQTLINPQQTHYFVAYNKPHLESLLQKAVYLEQILEKSSGTKIETLESQIRNSTHLAEDIIESHMVDQVVWWHTHSGLPFPVPDLQQVIKEFDSAIQQVEIVEDKTSGSSSSGDGFLPDRPSSKNALVGADEALLQLKDQLTGQERELQIIPIVGMGGIGKTKLSQELYQDKLITSHFDVRVWTTISQDYNVRAVLLGLLRRPNDKISDELFEHTDLELITILHKRLYCRRYLVVLDDMWSIHSWDAIRSCFPDNNNGSRIILTTRELNVARCVGTHKLQHKVELMNESESWNLLKQVVFGEEDCPFALEEIGRKIASDCRGLPLAINVIGGFLSKAKRSIDVWERISNDVSETDDNQFSNVLSLSYNHLPNHLKPCFLYMGAFPEDYEIKVSRLIHMWIAEGLVKANGDKSLEEEAEVYLEALVERNLVLVTRKKSNGKALCYGMHDLLRDLCTRKGGDEKFVHVKNERVDQAALHKARRVSVHTSSNGMEKEFWSLARSFICPGPDMPSEIVSPLFFLLRLIRVLDVLDMQFPEFPKEVLKLINLRYLAFSCSSKSDIPKEISRLLNLQTLIGKIKGGNVASEIWEISDLRHLKLRVHLKVECMKQKIHENLQKIYWVTCNPAVIGMGFFKTIPNIRNLGILLHGSIIESGEVVDLSYLHKLQTLRCDTKYIRDHWRYLPTLRIPCSLTKLTLFECVIFQRDLTTLCALPNLEVLKLGKCVFENEEFELKATKDDVFRSLQFLHLVGLNNLVRWTADDANFPTLRELVLHDCPVLEEIPSAIGNISTIQSIKVKNCKASVEASAREIEEVQQSENDNYDLKVYIYDDDDE